MTKPPVTKAPVTKPPEDRRLFRFLFRRGCEGVAGGWTLMLLFIWTDVGGIGGLMDRSPVGWIALLMLAAAFALTGAAVAMGLGAMALGRDD